LRNAASAGRIGTPVDLARLIAFLVSEDARRMTGQTIRSRVGQ
jgi:3-oxoacyl-[acyl-carrier protein] reductase